MNGSTTGQQQSEASSSENSEGARRRRSSFGRAAEDNKENEVVKDYTDEQVQMVRRYDCERQYTGFFPVRSGMGPGPLQLGKIGQF